jgi:predicted membrane-bound spermidine synthase
MKQPSKYNWGLFFISFSTLLFEISLTRVYSVSLWYNFGFLIISTALLGFGVSGVVLSLWKKLRDEYDLDKSLGRLSILLCLSIVASYWLQQKIPFDPFSLYTDRLQLLYMPVTYMLVAIPFFFAGLSLSLLFTRYPNNINRLYAFDLTGAALGCIAIVFTMPWLGGGGSVLLPATFAAIAALLFFNKSQKLLIGISALLAIVTFLISLHSDELIPLRITANKQMSNAKIKPVYTKWNTFSRIDLYVRNSSLFPQKKSPRFIIDQGTAATGLAFDMMPDVKTVLSKYNSDSLYLSCVAYLGKVKPSILVIGSGSGTQVRDALHYGAGKITAVDINPIINYQVLHNPYWADLFHQPQVKLFTDEGRNFVRTSKEKYDAIVSVHTITNAAIASGALSLTENYMFTKEAFEDYYDHLTDSGVLYFTRPEFQLARVFSTAREVLEENNVKDPLNHFYAFTYHDTENPNGRKSFFAAFIMSKAALSQEQVDRMTSFIGLSKSDIPVILYDPFNTEKNIYDSILKVKSLPALYRDYPFEIKPATDNNPYFNHHTRWSSLNLHSFTNLFSQNKMGRLALEDKPVAEVTLITLLIQVLIVAAIFILLPLWRFSSSGLKVKNVFPFLLYFSGLGCGFIMIEIVLIQQFGLLLGEPVYTFAIVLAALLLFTGVGAYLSGKYALPTNRLIRNAIWLLAALILAGSFFLTPLLRQAIALPMTGRIILSVLLMLPLGILLGIPFPSGIRMISEKAPSLIPWAWGMNGFFTVIGSVLALMLSMMIGFQAVLWIAVCIYLLSMWAILKTVKK